MQIILVMRLPHEQNTTRIKEMDLAEVVENKDISRISPYPPNFRSIAARIIDPAIGASTWALGNHR